MPLVTLNIIFFILQIILSKHGFTESLMLVPGDILVRPWIIITSMFLHGGATHLFFNMYVLLLFGNLIEQRIGSKRFLILYFVSGIVAAFTYSFFKPEFPALGASGAIMGIIGVTIMLLPHLKVLFLFFIPMSMRTAGIIMALIDLFGLFPGVAGTAHLGGMACGLIFGYYFKKQRKTFHKKFSRKVHLEQKDIDEYLRSGRI